MARKQKLSKKEIEMAATAAAAEAVEEIENDTIEEDSFDEPGLGFSMNADENYAKEDVFEEGFRKAQSLNTAPRYHIKKNSQFLCVKGYPYSWEKLQAEYGEGYYLVMAKSMANGQILKKQSEMVGDPSGGIVKSDDTDHETTTQDGNMAYLTMMQQMQDRAETRARQDAKAGESAMAGVMQMFVQMQQQTTQMMLAQAAETNKLIMAMSAPKGPDPVIQLLTTMIMQKPVKDDNGFTMANVLKMTQDAEARAEARVNKMQEQIEKKATELFEVKAETLGDGETEESGFKGLIKGFIPVLAKMVENHQAGQPTPEQVALMHEQQRLQGRQGLDQETLNQLADRPTIPAVNQPRQRPVQRPAQSTASVQNAQGAQLQPAPAQTVVQPTPGATSGRERRAEGAPGGNQTQVAEAAARKKEDIFTFCAPEIGNALMTSASASKTAGIVLEKLEKEGLSRQYIANTFRLEDFYGYADKYSLPDEAKPWLKDFYNAIQESSRPQPVQPAGGTVVEGTAPPSRPAATVVTGPIANGANGNAKPVAPKRSPEPRTGPRAQPRPAPKDL